MPRYTIITNNNMCVGFSNVDKKFHFLFLFIIPLYIWKIYNSPWCHEIYKRDLSCFLYVFFLKHFQLQHILQANIVDMTNYRK